MCQATAPCTVTVLRRVVAPCKMMGREMGDRCEAPEYTTTFQAMVVGKPGSCLKGLSRCLLLEPTGHQSPRHLGSDNFAWDNRVSKRRRIIAGKITLQVRLFGKHVRLRAVDMKWREGHT